MTAATSAAARAPAGRRGGSGVSMVRGLLRRRRLRRWRRGLTSGCWRGRRTYYYGHTYYGHTCLAILTMALLLGRWTSCHRQPHAHPARPAKPRSTCPGRWRGQHARHWRRGGRRGERLAELVLRIATAHRRRRAVGRDAICRRAGPTYYDPTYHGPTYYGRDAVCRRAGGIAASCNLHPQGDTPATLWAHVCNPMSTSTSTSMSMSMPHVHVHVHAHVHVHVHVHAHVHVHVHVYVHVQARSLLLLYTHGGYTSYF